MNIECSKIVKFIVKDTVYTIQYYSDNCEICCEKNCVNSLFTVSSLETCEPLSYKCLPQQFKWHYGGKNILKTQKP